MYYFILIFLFITLPHYDKPIIDSSLTLEQSLSGKSIPAEIKNQLILIDVTYYSFDGNKHQGQLLLNKVLEKELKEIFKIIEQTRFPLAKVIPIVNYKWNDSLSMADNNTSAFNYRAVKGTKKLSAHSFGRAIDINPFFNPQYKRGKVFPHNGTYNKNIPGTLYHESTIVKEFKKRGWKWGGSWRSTKDYMHFEKPEEGRLGR